MACAAFATAPELFGQTFDQPQAAQQNPDFRLQGEYVRADDGLGLQVVARGDDDFLLLFYTGGLPGAGWNGIETRRVEADRDEAEDYVSDFTRHERKSPTLGLPAPSDAVTLFSSPADLKSQWLPTAQVNDAGFLLPGATSVETFSDYTMHVEFRTPFEIGQKRGRSEILHQGRYEIPIVDSFGSSGKPTDTGGIPGVAEPSLNMALPPLTWQTLDFDFIAARFEDGQKTSPAKITIRLNGITVQRDVEVEKLSDSAVFPDDSSPGPLVLKDDGSPVNFRNIWVQPRDFSSLARRPIVPAFERFYTQPDADPVAGGRLLLSELNCLSCHEADSELVRWLNPKQAPILTDVSKRIHPEWMVDFISDPHSTKPGTTMPDVMAGMTSAERRDAALSLVNYLVRNRSVDLGGDGNHGNNGLELFQQVGCVACHQSRDETLRVNSATSVPLPDLAKKYSFVGLDRFLQNPAAVRPSSRMPHIGLDDKERRSIVKSLVGGASFSWSDNGGNVRKPNLTFRVYHGQWGRMPKFDDLKPVKNGEVAGFSLSVAEKSDHFGIVYEGHLPITTSGTYTFRTASDDGSVLIVNGEKVVNNDGVHGVESSQGSIKLEPGIYPVRVEFFEASGGEELNVFWTGPGVPGRRLDADLVLSPEDVPDAVRQMTSGTSNEGSDSSDQESESDQYTFDASRVEQGRVLFTTLGCANCHEHKEGGDRVASQLKAPALDASKPGNGCVAGHGESAKPGRPNFELSAEQQAALTAALTDGEKSTGTPQKQLAHIFNSFNCYACHERDGVGGPEADRNALFTSTIPEMGDEGRIPPILTGVGDKLKESYLKHIFSNGANERPYMKTRMPKFGLNGTEPLISLVRDADLKTEATIPVLNDSPKRIAAVGRKLVGDKGLSCVKCHTFDKFKATGIQAIAMDRMATRLREDWFHRYLVNPVKYRPGTRMPTAFPNGRSVATEIFDGAPDRQLAAMWTWMELGVEGGVPSGVAGGMIELKPESQPIIYRNFLEGLSSRGIAVGYPEGANLAWDADRFTLALLWQGRFIDASMHWQGRGQGRQRPLGDNVIQWEPTAPVAVLESADAPWPDSDAKARGYRFSGYRLDEQFRPAFRYRTSRFTVVDKPVPVRDGEFAAFRREITVTMEGDASLTAQPKGTVYFRALQAKSVKRGEDGWWETADNVRVKVSGGEVRLRTAPNGQTELLVPIADGGTVIQHIVW